jgi:hypothetical protein
LEGSGCGIIATVGQVGLKLNGTHQLLAYADDVKLLGDNIDTVKKNTETLIDASIGIPVFVKYYLKMAHIGRNML